MKKIAIFLALASLYTQAKQCEAYNNMKHTKNTHHVILGDKDTYRVVRKHKGQYLVVIKGEQPAQRWVNSECINPDAIDNKEHDVKPKSFNTKKYYKKNERILSGKKGAKQNLLVVSWHNSFCQTHRSKKECKDNTKSNDGILVLHGLWPQPRNNAYCNVPKKLVAKDKHHQWKRLPDLKLSDDTKEMMSKYMPGYISALHKHEWIKHGTCYGKTPDLYYNQALSFTKQLNETKVGKLFRDNIDKKISLKSIKEAFESDFGAGTGESIALKCKNGLITELWITLTGDSDNLSELTKGVTGIKSRCTKGIVDPKGY